MRTSFWREVAEWASRGVVLRRRFPPVYGGCTVYVTPECGLRYWIKGPAAPDRALTAAAAELIKPRDVVWDIGANQGIFSFAAAGLAGPAGKIFAIEPDTWLVGLLRRSAERNRGKAAPVLV